MSEMTKRYLQDWFNTNISTGDEGIVNKIRENAHTFEEVSKKRL